MGEAQALATYLLALSILEHNGKTYVSREIRNTIQELEKHFNETK